VDDAIVVVEGAAHHIERGLSQHDAAIQAMNELFGPIVGITLVLMSVFLPAAFIPGLTGQMFAQFALVIAATALLSAINAATLPDGPGRMRTQSVLDRVSEIAGKNPAVDNVIAISGVSALDNNSTLANAGVAYIVLKDWSVRGKGEDLLSLFQQFNQDFAAIE